MGVQITEYLSTKRPNINTNCEGVSVEDLKAKICKKLKDLKRKRKQRRWRVMFNDNYVVILSTAEVGRNLDLVKKK